MKARYRQDNIYYCYHVHVAHDVDMKYIINWIRVFIFLMISYKFITPICNAYVMYSKYRAKLFMNSGLSTESGVCTMVTESIE